MQLHKSDADRNRWIAAVFRANLLVTNYTAACRKYWTESSNFKTVYEKVKPVYPPNFPNVPKSCLATTPSQERITKMACSSARNTLPDELEKFEQQMKKFSEIAKDM